MNIAFTFKQFEPSEHLRKYARRRFEKLGRFLGRNPSVDVQVVLSVEKLRHKAEVQLSGEGMNISAEEASNDMYASIDLINDKLEAQIKKNNSKGRVQRRKLRHEGAAAFPEDAASEEGPEIVHEASKVAPKPMSPEEAVMQLVARGYDFLVFVNDETERVNVIHRRQDGDYGLIDPLVTE